ARHANILDEFAAWCGTGSREAERKWQGVCFVPGDLQNVLIVQFILRRLHAGQTYNMAVGRIGVSRLTGFRPLHFLEEQEIAWFEMQHGARIIITPILQGGRGCAARQTALLVVPGIETDLVAHLIKSERLCRIFHQRLEYLIASLWQSLNGAVLQQIGAAAANEVN